MKTLQLRIAPGGIRPVGDAPVTAELARSGFTIFDLVSLVATDDLAALLAREAFRVHVVDVACVCMLNRIGEPMPSNACDEGQRLALDVTAATGSSE